MEQLGMGVSTDAAASRDPDWESPDGSVRLWCADCLDVLPILDGVDAVVTDPPYGLRDHNMRRAASMLSVEWDGEPADLSWLVPMDVPSIVWGGNYFDLPPTRSPLVWDKNNAGRDFADFEMAWTNLDMVARRIVHRPMNMDGGKQHPTQKPVRVMEWCLGFVPDATTILDPFMGSGTTGVACVRTGRQFIGIEKEPKYFDIAKQRIQESMGYEVAGKDGTVQKRMFVPGESA